MKGFPRLFVSAMVLAGCFPLGVFAQSQAPSPPKDRVKAEAYYHFAMGHLNAELAESYGNRGEYFNKAIEHYRQAMKLDPGAGFLVEELTGLYIQAGRLREAVLEAETILKDNPKDLNARRLLARIYARMLGDATQGRGQQEMLRRAIEQFQFITVEDPKDVDSWLRLGWLQRIARNSSEAIIAYKNVLAIEPDNEDALMGMGLTYGELGDSKTAAVYLDRIVAANPNSLSALTQLASTYEQNRDYEKAAEILEKALALAPQNNELRRALAQTQLFAGRYERALTLFEELSVAEPDNAQVFLRLSQIYRQQRKMDKAHDANNRAKALDPTSLEIQFNEAALLEGDGRLDDAVNTLQRLLDSTRKASYSDADAANRAIILERLAFMLRNGGRYEQAVQTFREMEVLDPTLGPKVNAQIIETYRQAKDYAKAEQVSQASINKFPEDRTLKVIRSSVLADLNRFREASSLLNSMLGGDADRDIHLSLAQVYEKAKSWSEMAASIDAAEKLSDSPEERNTVSFMRGAMLERMKRHDEAEAEFRKLLEKDPDNSGALNYLGYMLADRNVKLQEALQLIQRAVELDPDNGAYLDSMGWVYYRLDRLQEAEEYLLRAVEKVGRDPVVNSHLGDVYFKRDKVKEAIAQWEKALKEWESGPASEVDPEEMANVQRKLENARVRLAKESSSTPKNQR